MKRLIIEFKEEGETISTELQYFDDAEKFNRLEILGLVSNLLVRLSNNLTKIPRKDKKTKR